MPRRFRAAQFALKIIYLIERRFGEGYSWPTRMIVHAGEGTRSLVERRKGCLGDAQVSDAKPRCEYSSFVCCFTCGTSETTFGHVKHRQRLRRI